MDWLDNLSKTASNVGAAYQSFQTPTVPTNAAPTPANTAPAMKTNWMLIGGIGAALLVVMYFFTRK